MTSRRLTRVQDNSFPIGQHNGGDVGGGGTRVAWDSTVDILIERVGAVGRREKLLSSTNYLSSP